MGTVLPFLNTFFFYRFFFVVEDSNPSALLESESLVSCPFSLSPTMPSSRGFFSLA